MADTFIIECTHGAVWYAQILTKPRLVDVESMRPGDVARIVTLDQVDVRLCTECEENNEPMCTYCGWSGQGIAKHQLVCKHLSDALTEEER